MLPYLKSVVIWVAILVAAVLNGGLRESLLAPWFGAGWALPLSGLTLMVWVFLLAWWLLPWLGGRSARDYLAVGGLWVALTLAFELGLGRYVMDRPWGEVFQVFNLARGDLFLLVLLFTGVCPWWVARLRGLF